MCDSIVSLRGRSVRPRVNVTRATTPLATAACDVTPVAWPGHAAPAIVARSAWPRRRDRLLHGVLFSGRRWSSNAGRRRSCTRRHRPWHRCARGRSHTHGPLCYRYWFPMCFGIDTPHNGNNGTDFLILVLILPIIMVIMVLMLPIAVRILLMSVLILPIIIGTAHFVLHGRRLWPLR